LGEPQNNEPDECSKCGKDPCECKGKKSCTSVGYSDGALFGLGSAVLALTALGYAAVKVSGKKTEKE